MWQIFKEYESFIEAPNLNHISPIITVISVRIPSRVAKCHGYDRNNQVKVFAGWGKKMGISYHSSVKISIPKEKVFVLISHFWQKNTCHKVPECALRGSPCTFSVS